MKAFVLAAGKGERLKILTAKIPKPMLMVKGEMVLEHNLKWLQKNGISEAYINLHHLPETIKNHFGNGALWKVKLTYSYEKEILGTSGAVRKIVDDHLFKETNGDYVVIYGDNFYPENYDLKEMLQFHKEKASLTTIGLYPNVNKKETGRCGVAILDNNHRIVDFVEKPDTGEENLKNNPRISGLLEKGFLNAAVYILNKKAVEHIPQGVSDFGKDIFPYFLKNKLPLYGYVFEEPLVTIDTVELYNQANLV